MKTIKAITIDLDNTLIDFIHIKRHASGAAASAMVQAGLPMSEDRAKRELFDFYLETNIEGNDIFERFLKKHEAFSERTAAAAINAYITTKLQELKPYPDVQETLHSLKQAGLKLAIVTDAPRLKGYQRLDALGIADMFDVVVGFEDTGNQKPSPLPFIAVLTALQVKPEEALHVGDWPERDIAGAVGVGMKTAWAKYGSSFSELPRGMKCDWVLSAFSDLRSIVLA